MGYFIAQLFALISFILSLCAYHRNSKSKILSIMIISNILNLIHYLLLNAFSGCFTKVVAIIRDLFIILKEKNKRLNSYVYLIIFMIIYIIIAIYTYNGVLSLLPLLAAIIYIIFIWNGDKKTVKKVSCFCYFLWLIYNIFVFSIIGIISNLFSIISTFIAVKRSK